ncbi:MAG: hypothetical protein KAJ76_06825 [Candidatus Heimdallarchaeota archaeon]|nr:hypothetical protein [Candidatus Heimdallarchaeota archaeon]MCK5298599.1 hypothetical protein [Candidatus Heimdallarchaeota archaeon]
MYRDRRTLNLTLLIIVIVIVTVIAISIISVNAVIGRWGIFEILAAIGGALLIIGGVGVYTSYAGGFTISNTRLHARAPEVARAEINYARKRRKNIPWISLVIMLIGVILLSIGLSRIW